MGKASESYVNQHNFNQGEAHSVFLYWKHKCFLREVENTGNWKNQNNTEITRFCHISGFQPFPEVILLLCIWNPGPSMYYATLIASGTSLTAPGSNRTRRVTSLPMASVFLNLWPQSVIRTASPAEGAPESALNGRDAGQSQVVPKHSILPTHW